VVHGIGQERLCDRDKIIVMIALGMENLMQHVLLEVYEVTEQCVVVVLD